MAHQPLATERSLISMPLTEQLLREMSAEESLGIVLMAQLDAVPETLQVVIVTTEPDPTTGNLRDLNRYLIRAIGVAEHRLTLGLFKSLRITEDHPLLYAYNTDAVGLFFRGETPNADSLVLDVLQGYASVFGQWRSPPTYFNLEAPLHTLLTSGGGLLGEMPRPLADRLSNIMEAHGLETRTFFEEEVPDEHGRERKRRVMLLDDAFIVAFDFTIERLGKA
jgi:hypothetical protein